MPKIISAQELKQIFLRDDFPEKGYFVIDMKERPFAQVLELGEHIKQIKRRKPQTEGLAQRVKNKLKEAIL